MPRTPTRPLTAEQALRRRCQRMLADQRRRARAVGVQLPYGLDELLALVRDETQCVYCLAPLGLDLQLDHAIPVARGGKHELINLMPCCRRCNGVKGMLLASEFHELRALLSTWHPAAREDIERRLIAGGRVYAGRRRPKGA